MHRILTNALLRWCWSHCTDLKSSWVNNLAMLSMYLMNVSANCQYRRELWPGHHQALTQAPSLLQRRRALLVEADDLARQLRADCHDHHPRTRCYSHLQSIPLHSIMEIHTHTQCQPKRGPGPDYCLVQSGITVPTKQLHGTYSAIT